jgi:hypothetical protein
VLGAASHALFGFQGEVERKSFVQKLRSQFSRSEHNRARERARNMAITVICVTLLFIVFTVPINIYVPISHLARNGSDRHVIPMLEDWFKLFPVVGVQLYLYFI